MEPAFFRGDLLFLTNNREDPIQAGEILVFKVKDRDIPIVHRVIKLHRKYVCMYGKGSSPTGLKCLPTKQNKLGIC